MGCIHATEAQFDDLLAAIKKNDQWRADQMPDEAAALRVFNEAYRRLQEFGWRESMYAPQDKPLELQLAQDSEAEREIRERFDQPEPPRVAHGIPDRMDRVSACGNAVVPPIVEMIGRAVLASLERAA